MLNTARNIQRRRTSGDESGFTLIELLIVIVVLGILAAIVVFALGGVTGQSAVAACNSDAKTVSTAVSAYSAQNGGTYPTSIAAMETSANNGPYLKSAPATTYYTIGIDGSGNVTVELQPTDPGVAWTGAPEVAGVPATSGLAAVGSTAGQQYEGPTQWVFATGAAGQNVCAAA